MRAPLPTFFSCLVVAGGCAIAPTKKSSSQSAAGTAGAVQQPACPVGTTAAPTPAPAGLFIRNGGNAGADYPFVGMLYSEIAKGNIITNVLTGPVVSDRRICSASVLCPNVVITAAHCFDDPDHAETFTLHFGASPGQEPTDRATAPRGAQVRIMSLNGATGKKDLALLQLDKDLGVAAPPVWAKELPDPGTAGGPAVTLVGYGSTGTGADGTDTGYGTKLVGSMRYMGPVQTPDNPMTDQMALLHPLDGLGAPTSKTVNACTGDSGGAALIDGALYGVLAKVMNYSGGKIVDAPTCASANMTFAVAIPRQLDWIKQQLVDLCSDGGKSLSERADLVANPAPPAAPGASPGAGDCP
jgi:secreted trypsin-like serine protease